MRKTTDNEFVSHKHTVWIVVLNHFTGLYEPHREMISNLAEDEPCWLRDYSACAAAAREANAEASKQKFSSLIKTSGL